jgi:hypothetical protein
MKVYDPRIYDVLDSILFNAMHATTFPKFSQPSQPLDEFPSSTYIHKAIQQALVEGLISSEMLSEPGLPTRQWLVMTEKGRDALAASQWQPV